MGTSIKRSSARATELYMRGQAYGIPGVQVDGMDVLAMKEAGEKASDYVRSGNGPYILEAVTYRYRGHSSRIRKIPNQRRGSGNARKA